MKSTDNGDQPINKVINESDLILAKLRNKGCRITNQRKLLINIILENDCSCCKEIYFKAVKRDPSVGIATVYRMVRTLEETGAIDRRNMYRISLDETYDCRDGCEVVLRNNRSIKLSYRELRDVLQAGLKLSGIVNNDEVDAILISAD